MHVSKDGSMFPGFLTSRCLKFVRLLMLPSSLLSIIEEQMFRFHLFDKHIDIYFRNSLFPVLKIYIEKNCDSKRTDTLIILNNGY